MRLASNLTEGMREGDLADLVLPLLSVDEFVSKVDEKQAMVFGFYVHDQGAADDLNRFLQKSAVPILDSEVSPSPDQHGYFMVFVELTKNSRLAENVADILGEIEGLVDVDEWQMRIRGTDDLIPFSMETLANALKTTDETVIEQAILDFLQPSAVHTAVIEGDLLLLHGDGSRWQFDVLGFDRLDRLLAQHRLTETAIAYDLRSVARTNRLARMLGPSWSAVEMDRATLLHRTDDPRGLLLR